MKKGSTHSAETIEKMKSVDRRRKPMQGKFHSEETKKKIGISRTGKGTRNAGKVGVFRQDTLLIMSESAKKRGSNHTKVSLEKMSQRMNGEGNPRFKPLGSKRSDGHGYILVKTSCGNGFKDREFEHVHIIECSIGRKINKRTECVHHINYNKQDNRIENLQLMAIKDHKILHLKDNLHKHLFTK